MAKKIKVIPVGNYDPKRLWSITEEKALKLILQTVPQVPYIPEENDASPEAQYGITIATGSIQVEILGRPVRKAYRIGLWKNKKYPIWIPVHKGSYPSLYEYIRNLNLDEYPSSWEAKNV